MGATAHDTYPVLVKRDSQGYHSPKYFTVIALSLGCLIVSIVFAIVIGAKVYQLQQDTNLCKNMLQSYNLYHDAHYSVVPGTKLDRVRRNVAEQEKDGKKKNKKNKNKRGKRQKAGKGRSVDDAVHFVPKYDDYQSQVRISSMNYHNLCTQIFPWWDNSISDQHLPRNKWDSLFWRGELFKTII